MRSVEVTKKTRNKLRDEHIKLMNVKNAMSKKSSYKDMGEYDKNMFSYLISTLEKLTIQINALEFVLNEDTGMNDVTKGYLYEDRYGINKETALKWRDENEARL